MDNRESWDDGLGGTLHEEQDACCPHCGEPLELDLFEVWPATREFMLNSCCEGRHEDLLEDLQDAMQMPQQERVKYLQPLRDLFVAYGIPCRQVYGSWSFGNIRLDFGVELGEVEQAPAAAFIAKHHRHNKAPRGWRWGQGAYNGPDLVAVCWIGRPVARGFDKQTVVEVNRLCVDPSVDPELVWNACSQLYAAAAREAKRRGFRRVVTYTLESEAGATLKAAGWVQVDSKANPVPMGDKKAVVKGRDWNTASRPRGDNGAPTCNKIRWGKVLAA